MEIDKRLLSKSWRLEHLYSITNKAKQKIPFKRNRAQLHFSQNRSSRNLILKSRQLGFTTDEAIDALDDTLFNKNHEALLISYDKPSAEDIFDKKIDFAWKNLIPQVQDFYGIDRDTKNTLKVNFKGSGESSMISVRQSGRSGTFHRVHISEFAKICKKYPAKAKEVITGTIPSVPMGGRIDIESTAEGEGGEFYDMFWEAWERGEPTRPTEYKAHFYNWQWDDEEIAKIKEVDPYLPQEFKDYQKKHNALVKQYPDKYGLIDDIQITYYYYKWISLNKKWEVLFQEYPTTAEEAFASTGTKLFDRVKLDWQKQFEKSGEKVGDWIYYEKYCPSHAYALGADVAEGVGQDSSTAVIIDFTGVQGLQRARVVAEYCSNKIEPDQFAHEIKKGANKYGGCLCAIERNSCGLATIAKAKMLNLELYKETKFDKGLDEETKKIGWRTDGYTKPKMLYELNEGIEEQRLEIPSKQIVRELRSYDRDDLSQVRFDPEQSNHWDRVIALAVGWQMKVHASTTEIPRFEQTFNKSGRPIIK